MLSNRSFGGFQLHLNRGQNHPNHFRPRTVPRIFNSEIDDCLFGQSILGRCSFDVIDYKHISRQPAGMRIELQADLLQGSVDRIARTRDTVYPGGFRVQTDAHKAAVRQRHEINFIRSLIPALQPSLIDNREVRVAGKQGGKPRHCHAVEFIPHSPVLSLYNVRFFAFRRIQFRHRFLERGSPAA